MVAMIQTDHNSHLELITSMVNSKIRDLSSLWFDVSTWFNDYKVKFTLKFRIKIDNSKLAMKFNGVHDSYDL